MIIYGYVRVSSKDQNEDRQQIAMKQAGVYEKNIYADKQSGKDFCRPQYKKLMRKIKKNDVVYIKSIDRHGNFTTVAQDYKRKRGRYCGN